MNDEKRALLELVDEGVFDRKEGDISWTTKFADFLEGAREVLTTEQGQAFFWRGG